jgi:glycerophosphoryl diester phosphodiesterase
MARVIASGSRNLALTRAVIADIRKAKMQEEIVIQSFSPVVCLVALVEAPMLRTEFLIGGKGDNPERWERLVNFAKLIGVAGINMNHEVIDLELLQTLHQEGKSVAAWTVDDPAVMSRLVDWGVDALITNKPDVALQLLRERNRHP